MFPMQRPFCQPIPVPVLTLSSSGHAAILDLAFSYAVFHAPPKSGRTRPESETGGGFCGRTWGKVPAIGVSVGTGKGVNGSGVTGS